MPTSIPKRHHFVPQMLLRLFTDEDGNLYYFSKQFADRGIQVAKPENLFCQTHLYSTKSKEGVLDVHLERYYARLESAAKPVIDKILSAARSGERPGLSTQERETWDLFFCNQWKRVPEIGQKVFDRENIETRIQRLTANLEARRGPLTPEEARNIQDPKWVERVKRNAMVDALKHPSPQVLKLLKQKGLAIAVIRKPAKSFVIGSVPVVKLNYLGREHLSDPTVEVWLPIASDVAVSPAPVPQRSEFIDEISDVCIRHINSATLKQSKIIAGRSHKLIVSLVRAR
jgi:hypothetical protein